MRWIVGMVGLVASMAAAESPSKMTDQILQCWNVGSLPTSARSVSVEVSFEVTENGLVVNDTIGMTSWTGGSEDLAEQVFASARRAIIRCGAMGLDATGPQVLLFTPLKGIFVPSMLPETSET